MNTEISNRRRVVTANFPLASLRKLGRSVDGTVNDALLAISGGALRSYLQQQRRLPTRTLLAGVPVSIRKGSESLGNELSTIVCPLGTTTRDPLTRLRNISRITRRAKQDLGKLSQTARQDYMNLVLLPAMVLTLAHASTAIPPAFNVVVSNVPGPDRPLYLGAARLREMYPLSVVTDAQALNITAVSCGSRVCLGVTSCPDQLPGIEQFGNHLDAAYRDLQDALKF
jgi:WS/DGAT/MGAT family acyltransferase